MAYRKTDMNMSFNDQLYCDHVGPVFLISTYKVPVERKDELMEAWIKRARFMRAQQGNLGAQMHRGIGGASILVNYATWESLGAYQAAVERAGYDPFAPEDLSTWPILLEKVAIPGLCLGC